MALFTALAIASAALQYSSAKKASDAQAEATAVSSANETYQNIVARRRAAREERIRRAQISQSAVNSGVSNSSGQLGAQSALRSNAGSAVALQSANLQASLGISAANQAAASAQSRANIWGDVSSFSSNLYNQYNK